MAEEKTARERWQEWEERTGFQREHGGGGGSAQTSSPREPRQKVMDWARERVAPKPSQKAVARVREFIVGTAKLQSWIREGKIKGTLAEHQQITRATQKKHEEKLRETLQALQEIAPKGATVMGRVKTEGSMLEKIPRKAKEAEEKGKPIKYERTDQLQDITGTTVVVDSLQGSEHTLAGIREKFKVIEFDDYVTKPQKGHYRAFHMVIETPDGLQKEVQVKTKRQIAFSKWSHDVMKPQNLAQLEAAKRHGQPGGIIDKYAEAMSNHLLALDRGMPSNAPTCPEEARPIFGCVNAA